MAVLVALTLVLGPHPAAAAILAFAYLSPSGFLVAAAFWSGYHAFGRSRAHRRLPAEEAVFLRGMAGEIDAGASVRQAIIAAADRAPALNLTSAVRMAAAGRPADEVADRLEAALPTNGRMAGAAFQLVTGTGARASAVFAGLAVRAADAGDLDRERRTLTAQARLSAWLVGGLPVGVTVVLAITGRGAGLDGAGGVVTVAGVGLISVGGLVVWLMVRDS